MEDRKRPASYDHDESAPPHKKHAASNTNGNAKGHQDSDMPGRDELDRFQKEAIWRQMAEYKREKLTLEAQLNDFKQRSTYHDDHLRALDAWFGQLLDEVHIWANKLGKDHSYSAFPSALLSADNPTFDKHLKSRTSEISAAITKLFSNSTPSSPEVKDLQGRIAQLLLAEKSYINKLEKTRLDKEQLEERLETASARYMVAEKKIDRARSITVAKLDRQATSGGRNDSGSATSGGADGAPGKNEGSNGQAQDSEALAESETTRKAALATSEKLKEQLERLAAENEKLTNQITVLATKHSHLTDDDYSKTDLFKLLKSQHEDAIKRNNDLEATNAELKEESEKLQLERTSYRVLMDAESQAAISEKELQLTKAESDLSRIRAARDELSADVQMRKAAHEEERASVNQTRQLAAASEDRIRALELETERLRGDGQLGDSAMETEVESLSVEELRTKYLNLDRHNKMLNQELASMGTAYKKSAAAASQKTTNLSNMEEKISRLAAEKSRADQKYFAAMKAKDAREQEVRILRTQNSKSSDIVSQLKEAEAATRALVINQEKQLVEMKDALSTMTKQQRASQQQLFEKTILAEGLKSQVEEIRASLTARDKAMLAATSTQRKTELEAVELKAENAEMERRLESWQSKGAGSGNDHLEALRALAICTVCRKNFKDTVIKTCGHVFCKDCVEDRMSSRMRKCPNCNKAFGKEDYMRITL